MKRKISLFLLAAALFSLLAVPLGIVSSANFGSGARVVGADANMVKTGLIGKEISFTDTDFKSALCLSDFDSIRIIKIPPSTEGTLLLDGRRVGEGKIIKRRDIATMTFIPASESVRSSSFRFALEDGSGTEMDCILRFTDKVNYEPKAELSASSLMNRTQRGIPFYSSMCGTDPEGDKISYIVVLYPKGGVLEIKDKESGAYCYTPAPDFLGEDSFTYVLRDEYGNYSHPTTVTVTVTERLCGAVYCDMLDRAEYNAAVAMTALNVMNGTLIGDDFYFKPDEQVSRAEFIAMAMKCAGAKTDSGVSKTIFDDDEKISPSLKPYISAAQRTGIISGDFKDGGLYLSPNEPITGYEAAKIMASLLGYDGSGEEKVFFENESIPVWAREGVMAMSTLGIFSDSNVSSVAEPVSRADAAEFLYRLVMLR